MSRRAEALLVLLVLVVWTAAAVRVSRAYAVVSAPVRTALLAPEPPSRPDIIFDATEIAANGIFRVPRHLMPHTISEEEETLIKPVITAPAVYLKAIVGGPPWYAVLSGDNGGGTDQLVRTGDSLGTVEVRSVSREGVILSHADSTWEVALAEGQSP